MIRSAMFAAAVWLICAPSARAFDCAALNDTGLMDLPGAPTTILTAAVAPACSQALC